MQIETLPTASLIPYARNSRTHDEAQVAQIAGSIREFGFTNPVLIDADNGIIAGHGRVLAAGKLDLDEVPCIRLAHLTETQKRAYIIADNKLALNAGWDEELLGMELADLAALDFDLDLIGFGEDELAALMVETTEGETDPDDVPEPPADPVTVLGDVWVLGKHRLLCGDSTSIDAVEKLMAGSMADMVFTDPPYGMRLDTDYTKMAETKVRSKKYEKVIGDEVDFDAAQLIAMFADSKEQFWWGADWYYETLPKDGSWIVWDKRSEASDGLTGNHFEMLWSKNKHKRYIIRHLWTGFTARNNDTKRVHPTEKPVVVLENVLNEYSKSEWVIIDLFGGSGSTLIACEKTARDCRMMELDPKYCDVIVTRWQAFAGNQAIHEASGKTFDEMKAAK